MEKNKTATEHNKRELKKNELEQVTGGGSIRTPNIADRDINYYSGETPRGMQTTLPVTEQYTTIV